MKKNNVAMIFGILFGIGVAGLSYFNLVLALALAFANKGDFLAYSRYIYPILGIIAIIGAALARKSIVATRIMLLIPNVIHIALVTYTAILGALTANMMLFAIYAAVAILGIISLLFAFLAKNRDDYQSPPPSFTPPSQSAQM